MSRGGLRPFFSYYGSKYRLAPHYPPPRYNVIYEPFAGSAGYSLFYHDRAVHLIDKDPVIAGLWDYLIHVPAAEILRLPAVVEHIDDVRAPQEAKWLIGFWLNAATTGPCKRPSKWVRQAQAPENNPPWAHYSAKNVRDRFWGEAKRALVAAQVEHIRHWTITLGSYADAPDDEATWHVDPPYRVKGIYYKMSARQIDFAHLGAWCRERCGQVMVCENMGAGWLPFRPFRRHYSGATAAAKDGRGYSIEAIWTHDTATIPLLGRVAERDERPRWAGEALVIRALR